MTRTEIKPAVSAVKELLAQEPDALREIVRSVMQAMLEAEMDEALGAGKSERSDARPGYRSGHYLRTLVTRVGKLELRVPQDRAGRSEERRVGNGGVSRCRSRWAREHE